MQLPGVSAAVLPHTPRAAAPAPLVLSAWLLFVYGLVAFRVRPDCFSCAQVAYDAARSLCGCAAAYILVRCSCSIAPECPDASILSENIKKKASFRVV